MILLSIPAEQPNPFLSGTLLAWVMVVIFAVLIGISVWVKFGVENRRLRESVIRAVLFVAGGFSLLLGIIGIVLPLMPTVPFVILTAICWGRASPRFHYWLMTHKLFGPMIRDWMERRAIPRRAKYLAWVMMVISCAGVSYRLWTKHPEYLWLAFVICAICLAVGIWMSRQPDA